MAHSAVRRLLAVWDREISVVHKTMVRGLKLIIQNTFFNENMFLVFWSTLNCFSEQELPKSDPAEWPHLIAKTNNFWH